MAIYQLTHGTYDGDMHYFFEGPDGIQEEFQTVCNELMREASSSGTFCYHRI